MWNADRSAYLMSFSGHSSTVTCGDFTPDGKTICTGSDDASLRIWNPKTGENIHVVKGMNYATDHVHNTVVSSLASHTESVECIALSPSTPWAATGGMDQKLIIWDLQHSLARCTCEHEDGVACLTWLGGSRYVATGCVDGRVRIWDSLSGECVKTLRGHTGPIQSLAVSPDGTRLVSVALDETARVFEIDEFR
ncbi:putative transcription factor WD40-like family [Helianthus annuus]|nr:putative transcription factor WD40-like family [Helianthus annuus]